MTAQQFENFIMFSLNGRYRLLKSAHVDEMLSQESMQHLQQLGGHIDKPVITATPLCNDKLFAFSYLKPDKDELGRPTVLNHTILIRCDVLLGLLKNVWNSNAFITEASDTLASPLPPVSLEIG